MWPFSRKAKAENGAESRDNSFLTFQDVFSSEPNTFAGVTVGRDEALTLPAVYRCVSLNAETIASLPVDCLVRRGDRREPYPYPPSWLKQPNPEYDWGQFIQEVQTSLELDGNSFILKVSTDAGRVFELWHLAPNTVSVERLSGTDSKTPPLVYKVRTADGVDVFAPNAMMHIKAFTLPRQLRGANPITYMLAQTIGTGMAAQQFGAQYFGNGAHLSGLIEVPGQLTEEQVNRLREQFRRRHGGISKSHAMGVLSGGATWKELSVSAEDSQFLATQKFTADQISMAFGFPPGFFDADGAKGYVTALHQSLRLWYQTGLLPRITRLERAFSSILPNQAYIKFNTNAFLRMDPEQRIAYYAAGQQGEWLTRNEIRALEEMNPMEGGDEPLKSVQWQPPDGGGADQSDDRASQEALSYGGTE